MTEDNHVPELDHVDAEFFENISTATNELHAVQKQIQINQYRRTELTRKIYSWGVNAIVGTAIVILIVAIVIVA